MARQRFPGQRNSLDALCRRLGVDNAHRQLHGALLDAQLLCEVYLYMTAGQGEIGFGGDDPRNRLWWCLFSRHAAGQRRWCGFPKPKRPRTKRA